MRVEEICRLDKREVRRGLAPATLYRVINHAVRDQIVVVSDSGLIADGGHVLHFLRHPVSASWRERMCQLKKATHARKH